MANNEKTRAAALAALRVYQQHPGLGGNGDATDLGDLLVDLAHLANTFTGDDETSGGYVLENALDVYNEERGDELDDYTAPFGDGSVIQL